MAKNRFSGYDPSDFEWYLDPTWCTELLLQKEIFDRKVWEPACGQGNMVKALNAAGYDVKATDIREWGPWGAGPWVQRTPLDFLGEIPNELFGQYDIVCNPPYGRAEMAKQFIDRALEVTKGKVAMLLGETFLFSQDRYPLFTGRWPLSRIYFLSSRPSMPPGWKPELKAAGGQTDYVWLIFEKDFKGTPTAHWLIREGKKV